MFTSFLFPCSVLMPLYDEDTGMLFLSGVVSVKHYSTEHPSEPSWVIA